MNAGDLIHTVQVQEKTTVTDPDYGSVTYAWATVLTVRAQVKTLSGRELAIVKGYSPTASVTVRMRYREGITSDHRLLFGNRVLYISSVVNVDEDGTELLLTCTEVADADH